MAKQTTKKLPAGFKAISKDGKSGTSISARIDNELYTRWQGAIELCKTNGIELVLSDIIRNAIEQACNDAEKITGKLIGQNELPIGKPSASKSVIHEAAKNAV